MANIVSAAKVGLVKGLRTFLQTFAGALVALPAISTVADIKVNAPAIIVALWVSVSAGLVAFLQNTAESL